MAADYPLADELKSEFRDRGAAVSGMQASTTSELMHRAEMGNNPRVNVAEQAFRENYRARQNASGQAAPSRPPRPRSSGPRPGMQNGANPSDPARHPSRPSYSAPAGERPSRPASSGSAGARSIPRDTLSEEIAGAGRARYRRTVGEERETPVPEDGRTKKKREKIRVRQTRAARRKAAAEARGPEEIEVQKGSVPVGFIAVCLIAVALLFSIVESFAEVYQISSSISRKEAELAALKETVAGLELKLDEKNDIRTIRSIAVGELGMAEEDSMQRRFVSVSGGERIEILEAPEEDKQSSPGGVLFSSLNEFFDRFR
ncbi:MAG: hypothetical protein II680_02885 [Clostridia bacterium]|nr:hypothetical protein [Clostridia bacterium]